MAIMCDAQVVSANSLQSPKKITGSLLPYIELWVTGGEVQGRQRTKVAKGCDALFDAMTNPGLQFVVEKVK